MLFETSLTPLPMFGLRRDMNRLLDDVITRTAPGSGWAPAVDVREDKSGISLSIELPGVAPENVDVTADNGLLTVKGHKSAERKEGDDAEYHLLERSYGSFTRSFRLPKGIDDSKITANFANGVLDVRVPKTALPQPKKIAIGREGASDSGRRPEERIEQRASSATKGQTSQNAAEPEMAAR